MLTSVSSLSVSMDHGVSRLNPKSLICLIGNTRKAGSLRRLLASHTLAFGKESRSDADLPVDSLFRLCNKQIKTLNLLTSVL
jgi:hypothetical protein